MSKIPRPSRNDLIRYMIRKGFTTKSQNGSHVKLKRQSITLIIPAGNKRMRPGLLLQILRTAEIDRNEFILDYNKGRVT